MKTSAFKSASVVRNCFRCGEEFEIFEKERVCPSCRRPQPNANAPIRLELSFREKQIVHLICQAKPNKEIAYDLHLTEGTIKEYLNRIFRKVGAKNRTDLAILGLTKLDQTFRTGAGQ